MADQTANKTQVQIVFSQSSITGFVDNEDYHEWLNGTGNNILRVYASSGIYEHFYKVNGRNVQYIEEVR